ncbi:MAG: hypothetical protein P4L85_05200 [Paludisphaera borealis]|uniref:hypothetical protein n=1 Tax=Paludisphaera borealis TaxID=1387353 RepID=UPI00284CF62E|nr:hypothetical protein [Paludisphaera borealis]MDR3618728.1 hypothetical protein [Paludisphaera borealis]
MCVVPGKRTADNAQALVCEFHRRTAGRPMDLITTDDHAPAHGQVGPTGLLYATVGS